MSTIDDVSSLSPLAPVGAEGLSRALLPFGQSTMLPIESYISPDVLAWERRNFVAGSWACAGRLEELAADGATQRAILDGDIPVLLTFSGDDVRAFANTCRHRAHVLLEDDQCSTNKSVLCVYHAWTYRLDGTLQGAPGFRDNEFFDKDDYGLVPLPSQVWHGWLFVNATGTAPAFEDHIGVGEVPAALDPGAIGRQRQHSVGHHIVGVSRDEQVGEELDVEHGVLRRAVDRTTLRRAVHRHRDGVALEVHRAADPRARQ